MGWFVFCMSFDKAMRTFLTENIACLGLFWAKNNLYAMLMILSRGGRVLKSELKSSRTKNMYGMVCLLYVP